jgi:Secretion system C-terminal sorting domain
MKNLTPKLCLLALLLTSMSAFCQSVPKLNSLATAQPTIFLDFDGHTVQTAAWQSGASFVCDAAPFTETQITEIFNRVSEDYRPFAVNITTDSTKYLAAPLNRRVRVIVTPTSAWYPGAGGVSYNNCFTWGDDTPAFVFCAALLNNVKYVSECCTHESGHSLGLTHQSRYDANCALIEYYNKGQGAGEISWAPVMGNSYYRNMTGWNNGVTPFDCSAAQDNLSIITTSNGFTYRTDDYAETLDVNTTTLNPLNMNASGIIAREMDKDAFKFTFSQNAAVHIDVTPFSIGANNEGANLDILVMLYNSTKQLIATYNPLDKLNVTIDTTLLADTYYMVVDGTGNSNSSNYGSLGSYTITGARGVLAIRSISLKGNSDGKTHKLNWDIIADEPIAKQVIEVSSNALDFKSIASDAVGITNFTYNPTFTGTLYYRLKATSIIGETSYSNIIALKSNGVEKIFSVSTLAQQDIRVTASANYSFNLYDANARLIASGKETKGINNIDVSNLTSGMYILQMVSDNYKQTERIIKQ